MSAFRTTALAGALAAASAIVVLSATPSSALVAWTCTSKDSAGKKFTHQAWGLFSLDTHPSAVAWATDKCEKGSRHPNSCKITNCFKSHD